MNEATLVGLVWVIVIAAAAPIISDLIPRVRVPVVVLEILLGIAAGPYVLDLIHHSEGLEIAKEIGVIVLFFLAGFEVEFDGISGNPLRSAAKGWIGSVLIALAIAFTLQQMDIISSFHLFAIAVTTTALGPLMPIMQDSGQLHTRFGGNVLAIGAIGEFAPVFVMAFLFNQSREAFITGLVIIIFMVVAGVLLFLTRRIVAQGETSHVRRIVINTLDSSAQFGVRISVLLLVILVYLAYRFDLDVLLGAFAGGFIVGQIGDVASTKESRKVMEWMKTKFEAIGFGVFIPVFFVMTGVDLNIDVLFSSGRAIAIMLGFVVASFLIRGLPVLLLYQRFDMAMRMRLALIAATQLPLVATLMNRFIDRGTVPEDVATAIIGGAVITVAVFPLLAMAGMQAPGGQADGEGKVVEGLPEIVSEEKA